MTHCDRIYASYTCCNVTHRMTHIALDKSNDT